MARFGPVPESLEFLETMLARVAAAGIRHVTFTGGEPTLHPRFVEILAAAKALALTTYVGTSGTMLARPAFAARAAPLLDEVSLSVHGPVAGVHDGLVGRPGAFAQARDAIANVHRFHPGAALMANVVVVRPNLRVVADTLAVLAGWGVRQVLVSNVAPEGAAARDYEQLAVPLDLLRREIPGITAAACEHGLILRFFGVPLCILGREAMVQSNDLHWTARATMERAAASGGGVRLVTTIQRHPTRRRVHPERCRGCPARRMCGGVFSAYARRFGDGELRPLPGVCG